MGGIAEGGGWMWEGDMPPGRNWSAVWYLCSLYDTSGFRTSLWWIIYGVQELWMFKPYQSIHLGWGEGISWE